MPKDNTIKKVLVIGSGPIVIGQAAEFDYAGAQACKVLKQNGINVVLVNSNPATIMTDKALADEIYLEPLTLETVKRIILKEKPDGVLASLGGQTGLTLAMKLYKEGFFDKHSVRLLGTNAEAIIKAEDREAFKETMQKIGQPCIPSEIAETFESAADAAENIGYPVIVRPAFTLGGYGGGVANNKEEFSEIAANGLKQSPIHQILVEKYIYGWKELEFEVVRDGKGNSVAVCSMENFDPVGIHTGDSIVVAPALTLSDKEFQMLRSASLDIINELGIEGGCNCQFALNPDSMEYAVIEVNPRVSRSSALASKATGYPIAKISAQIALGYSLDEIRNEITGKTFASFEPALDYIVVKIPKWPFDKFATSDRKLGTQMKATGEVMSIAPTFCNALMKAVRGAELKTGDLNMDFSGCDFEKELYKNDDLRLFRIYAALKEGFSPDVIHGITKIDLFFLYELKKLADFEIKLSKEGLVRDNYLTAKKLGFTDESIEKITGDKIKSSEILKPVYKMVDTCAGEFMAETPYFYSSYGTENEAENFINRSEKNILVLGSGPIRIGQGIEFDYSSVHCVWALKKYGYSVAIVNNNPETVSTDFDVADRLYFEPLTREDVKNIIDLEKPVGVVVAFGGQTAIKLTKYLDSLGITVLGTSAESIDTAEDREKFDKLLSECGIKRPESVTVLNKADAIKGAELLGYPVLVRPSYVIGGQNMAIASSDADIENYMDLILSSGIENPVLIDRYLMGTELEVDCISDGEEVLIPGIMEHIERAGIHSGDSIAVYPPYNLSDSMKNKIIECSAKLALKLKTKGLTNIQYLIYHNELYVIEVNPRASRTIPYISKVTGLPMVDIASGVMLGKKLRDMGYSGGLYPSSPYVAVKVPVFSFEKLNDVNSILGPEMKSTGEVLGLGKTIEEALFKGLLSAGFNISQGGGVYLSVADKDKPEIFRLAKKFADLGMDIYATPGTAAEIRRLGNDITEVSNLSGNNNIYRYINEGKINYIINTCPNLRPEVELHISLMRRALQLNIPCMSSLDTANALADMLSGRFNEQNTELVDINNMRTEKLRVPFSKMHTLGNDYIYIDNSDNNITCPESLAIILCNRHRSVGGDGIVLIGKSDIADAKMSIYNKDGSEGKMAGNSICCVAKYLYDNGIVKNETISVETVSGIKNLHVMLSDGKVSSVTVDMGSPEFNPEKIPALFNGRELLNGNINIFNENYNLACLSIGNPHAVTFVNRVDDIDIEKVGPAFENNPMFPERTNTEFVRAVNAVTLKMRVWERGNGETMACGTGACAAVVAAVKKGLCLPDSDITVKLKGGDLTVRYTDGKVYLTAPAELSFTGIVEI